MVGLPEFLKYYIIPKSAAISAHLIDFHPITLPKKKLYTARAVLITVYLRPPILWRPILSIPRII